MRAHARLSDIDHQSHRASALVSERNSATYLEQKSAIGSRTVDHTLRLSKISPYSGPAHQLHPVGLEGALVWS